MNSIISIYIPRMSLSITEEMIKDEFMKTIGDVSRIDFTSIDKKPGFNENHHSSFKSAFIHFHNFYNNTYSNAVLNTINSEKSYKFYPQCKKEYWILLKAKNPIAETWMNNAQIVENCRFLENKLEIQEEIIKQLQEQINKLELMYIKNRNSLQEEEEEIQDSLLFQRKQDIMIEKRNLNNFSISTNSSMPGLINEYDYNSLSSSSSLQELDRYNNSPISETRKKNSLELCGNE